MFEKILTIIAVEGALLITAAAYCNINLLELL